VPGGLAFCNIFANNLKNLVFTAKKNRPGRPSKPSGEPVANLQHVQKRLNLKAFIFHLATKAFPV
jgi:hypothetical protein